MIRCFECKNVNTNVEYVCGSGVGDYFCHDCASRNNFICPLCGSDMVLIKNSATASTTVNTTDDKSCEFCGRVVKTDWKYCPHCAKRIE